MIGPESGFELTAYEVVRYLASGLIFIVLLVAPLLLGYDILSGTNLLTAFLTNFAVLVVLLSFLAGFLFDFLNLYKYIPGYAKRRKDFSDEIKNIVKCSGLKFQEDKRVNLSVYLTLLHNYLPSRTDRRLMWLRGRWVLASNIYFVLIASLAINVITGILVIASKHVFIIILMPLFLALVVPLSLPMLKKFIAKEQTETNFVLCINFYRLLSKNKEFKKDLEYFESVSDKAMRNIKSSLERNNDS
jgi:hypothetical protein